MLHERKPTQSINIYIYAHTQKRTTPTEVKNGISITLGAMRNNVYLQYQKANYLLKIYFRCTLESTTRKTRHFIQKYTIRRKKIVHNDHDCVLWVEMSV